MAKKAADKTEEDLLNEIGDETQSAEVTDLLDEIDDTGAPAWIPDQAGEGIQGTVVARSEMDDQYNPGSVVPVVVIEDKEGDQHRIVGFASVLRNEINEKDPQKGDFYGVKYFGEKELKTGKFKGKNFKHYGTKVRRG